MFFFYLVSCFLSIHIKTHEVATHKSTPQLLSLFRKFNEDMVDATMPENQEEKDDLFIYTKDLEKELRYYGSFQMMVNDYYC